VRGSTSYLISIVWKPGASSIVRRAGSPRAWHTCTSSIAQVDPLLLSSRMS